MHGHGARAPELRSGFIVSIKRSRSVFIEKSPGPPTSDEATATQVAEHTASDVEYAVLEGDCTHDTPS